MTSPREYTQAQLKAFTWLPSGREWRANAGRLGASLHSLRCAYSEVVEIATHASDGVRREYRLTSAGQAEKARLIEEGLIS